MTYVALPSFSLTISSSASWITGTGTNINFRVYKYRPILLQSVWTLCKHTCRRRNENSRHESTKAPRCRTRTAGTKARRHLAAEREQQARKHEGTSLQNESQNKDANSSRSDMASSTVVGSGSESTKAAATPSTAVSYRGKLCNSSNP
jgi:uncharacterized protein with WD repeat